MFTATSRCRFPFRVTPGIRLSRLGFRFCWSIGIPFFSSQWYRNSTRAL